jgi:RNA polymerase sigma factor (sigma-70 family)
MLALEIRDGSQRALADFVMANMREALLYTQRVSYNRIDVQTRISLCYQEMCMSAKRYDPDRNLRFFAFAKAGLRGRMKTYWSSLNTVRNSKGMVSLDSVDTPAGLRAAHVGVPVRGSTSAAPSGAEAGLACPEDDHERSPREEMTGEIEYPNQEPLLARDQWEVIRKTLAARLSEQQWMILDLVYKGGLSFPQIGKLLDLTRSAIHASHQKALAKLRDGVASHKGLL